MSRAKRKRINRMHRRNAGTVNDWVRHVERSVDRGRTDPDWKHWRQWLDDRRSMRFEEVRRNKPRKMLGSDVMLMGFGFSIGGAS